MLLELNYQNWFITLFISFKKATLFDLCTVQQISKQNLNLMFVYTAGTYNPLNFSFKTLLCGLLMMQFFYQLLFVRVLCDGIFT
jgi:hypothetical protein